MKQSRSGLGTGWVSISNETGRMRDAHINRVAADRPVLRWAYTAPKTAFAYKAPA